MPQVSHISRLKLNSILEAPPALRGFYIKASKGSRGQTIGFLVSGIRNIEIEGFPDQSKNKMRLNWAEGGYLEIEDRIYSLGKIREGILFQLDIINGDVNQIRGKPKFSKYGYDGSVASISWKEKGAAVIKPSTGTLTCDVVQKKHIIKAKME